MSSLQDRVWGTIDENTTDTRRWQEARCRVRWSRPCRKLRSGQNLDASPALTRENVYALQQNRSTWLDACSCCVLTVCGEGMGRT